MPCLRTSKRLLSLLPIAALAIASLSSVACTSASDDQAAGADDDLTSGIATGTYLVDERPFGSYYAARLTLGARKTFEAEIVSSSGETSLLAGTYDILPARPNNPQSPVKSDKPTLYLMADSGAAAPTFEFDKLPGGALRLYHSARHASFTMKKDASWRPPTTSSKVIACTGASVNAKLTLDQAQNRRGTLTITRKALATHHDPPSASVPMTRTEGGGVPGYVYFEGMKGEQDYYVNMNEADFERGSGTVALSLNWAQNGEEIGVSLRCAFAR